MNGEFSINYNDGDPAITFSNPQTDYAHTTVTLSIPSESQTNSEGSGKDFYIAVPAQTYNKLAIIVEGTKVVSSDNTVTAKIKESTASSITVQRSHIYPIEFTDATAIRGTSKVSYSILGNEFDIGRSSCEWVRLWKGGKCFAAFNLGATITDYADPAVSGSGQDAFKTSLWPYITENVGGLYLWANATNKRTDTAEPESYREYTYDIQGQDADTAKHLWGNNWQMPTGSQLEALVSNCTKTEYYDTDYYPGGSNGFHGILYTGKGAYACNSIFLPAAGLIGPSTNDDNYSIRFPGTLGYYWSSTPSVYWDDSPYLHTPQYTTSSANSRILIFESGTVEVDDGGRNRGFSIRAILAE